MQSLAFLKHMNYDMVVPNTLRGFPDVNSRSPNEPTYMLSAPDVFKLISQFSDIDDRTDITRDDYAVLWAYARKHGWQDVFIDGGQLFLVSGLRPNNHPVPDTVARTLVVEINTLSFPNSVNLLEHAARFDPTINGVGTTCSLTSVSYVAEDRQIPFHNNNQHTPRSLTLVHEGMDVQVNLETANIRYSPALSESLLFKIEYCIQFL